MCPVEFSRSNPNTIVNETRQEEDFHTGEIFLIDSYWLNGETLSFSNATELQSKGFETIYLKNYY